ncbi:MAG: hypothetical protein AVDCRST_MAG88-788 [uncultured Thermomicrobiales bacterium]|uniref:VTT domain-containing protein n=1 Tax=uncultured Thermomicrobiales bacterium TaxID=1645740 RepID=A0A6J4UJL9_9BACT|nr:MAG: hypothetical protein AVDCRST_MAG88-788 [uncultured Thermomicrobiales bacterium]
MNDRLLELLLAYGVLALAPILVGGAIGLPLPGSLILLAAGAFARGGQLNPVALVLCALISTIVGNEIGYEIGRRGGRGALTRWSGRLGGAALVGRAERLLARRGGAAVLLSRFPLSPVSAIVNILAGIGHYPARAFILYNLVGVTLWVGFYVGLGYAFSASWDILASFLGDATQALTLAAVIVLLLVALVRTLRGRHHEAPVAPRPDPEPELRRGEG